MAEKNSKYSIDENGRTYGYDKGGGWDIDTSERTQHTSIKDNKFLTILFPITRVISTITGILFS